ncbi:hypothetical protein [Azospirillum argentinense]|nr:hypothetical protein [Azospirillum argentinense]
MSKPLSERIEARLREIGLKANAASLLAGGSRDLIRNIQRGRSRVPTGDNLLGLSRVLQVPPEFFSEDFDENTPLPAPQKLPPAFNEKYAQAIADLEEITDMERESFLEELQALARAARARKKRGG